MRAGEKERALATLELAKLPSEFFREARKLSDELWRDRLSKLERASVFRVGTGPAPAVGAFAVTDSQLVGWREDPLRGGSFFVADLATGKALAHASGAARATAVHAARDAVFVDWFLAGGQHFLSRVARDGMKDVALHALQLADVDPSGTRLLVRNGPKAEIVSWPGLEPVTDMGTETGRTASASRPRRTGSSPCTRAVRRSRSAPRTRRAPSSTSSRPASTRGPAPRSCSSPGPS